MVHFTGHISFTQMSTLCHQVLKESGPPHMKSFLTRVTVGEFSAEGEGNSKKLSKKRAALSILQDLKKLPFIPAVEKPKTHYKKRTKTILKVLQPGTGTRARATECTHTFDALGPFVLKVQVS